MQKNKNMKICIIGAGIVGLTTALELQDEFHNAQIIITADKFNKDTTSYVAAGVFRPGTSFSGPNYEITKKWIIDSYDYWDKIRKSSDASLAGVCQLSGYIFSKTEKSITRNHYIEKIVPIYRQATEDELLLCGGKWKYGSFFTTVLTENKLFLPYAMKKFENNHGIIVEEHLNSFYDIDSEKYDIIINCSGLGSKKLCKDTKLVPIRGQVIKVKAPWIKLAYYGDYDTYIIPGFEGVTLGGSRHFDSYSCDIDKYDTMSIRERCFNMLPSLKKSEYIREAVGLRPHRTPVRVEKDYYVTKSGKFLNIIHNYGHGGYGVTTSPGTAKYAVKLVKEILSSSNSNSLKNKL